MLMLLLNTFLGNQNTSQTGSKRIPRRSKELC